ncbi:MAG TPA: hypothetical protein VL988_08170 [Solirubrobacteraceae bacterium]|nr:hypothetical protein [Solirubrobacteraceae bacterium]
MSRSLARRFAVAGLVLLAALWMASSASAEEATFGISSFSTTVASTQAGGHPNLVSDFLVTTDELGNAAQQPKDVHVQLPVGLTGNPQAVPRCSLRDFERLKCSRDTQVGIIEPQFIAACHGLRTTLGANGGVGQVPPTTLTQAIASGGGTLIVESTAGIGSGDTITIGSGEEAETVNVSAVPSSTELVLSGGTFREHPAGTIVRDDLIHVANASGFCGGQQNEITIGSGPSAETAKIAYAEPPNRLVLDGPLEHLHANGEPVTHHAVTVTGPFPLYNLEPMPGHVATLGMSLLLTGIYIQLDFDEGRGGGITASINNISTLIGFVGSKITLWGVPAEPANDALRCNPFGVECGPSGVAPAPFITTPTNCSEPFTAAIVADSWQDPTRSVSGQSIEPPPIGCERLGISPTLSVSTDTTQADAPAGYTIDLKVPQQESASALATPDLKTVSVTLPAGTSLSPGGAAGLEACTQAQFDASNCPGASAVGTASISSPLLANPLEGHVYLAAATAGEPYRVFVLATGEHVTIRLTGSIHADPASGRLTITFDDAPQLPMSEFRASFFGGPSATLANPPTCGTATTVARVTSYAGQVAEPASSFTVSADSRGTPCGSAQPFDPRLVAGATVPLASAFSPFTVTIERPSDQQSIGGLTAQLPAGVAGLLSHRQLCGQEQAAAGTCPSASHVGSVSVAVGAGERPVGLSGSVYLTGPYDGAPLGLSIVLPASIGPFQLGTLVVRARVLVDPHDLHLTVISDPIPQVFAGIPLRMQGLTIALDEPGFMFNGTSCAAQTVTATVGSAQGASASLTNPFRLTGCSGLGFAPRVKASTQRHAGIQGNGASLVVTVANRAGPGQANMRAAAVQLPAQLRPRLSTIRRACPDATFARDPSACDAAARVGRLTVSTPALSAPLTGFMYLVAHGGRAYPSLVVTAEEQGVKALLEGTFAISGKNTIRASFDSLPDVPISSISVEFPRGPNSMLAATANPCVKSWHFPYSITGQNGARRNGVAPVAVSGCPRHRAAKPKSSKKKTKPKKRAR